MRTINIDRIKEVFEYRDGHLYYRHSPRHISRQGTKAGWLNENSYCLVMMDGKEYRAHRLIWLMLYGEIPNGYVIDHIDGNESNNNISNLRIVTESTNRLNQRMRKNSKSPYKGVCWDSSRSKWMARLKIGTTTYYLGRYQTAEEAAIRYDQKLREIGPPHSTFNFPKYGERSAHTGEIV